MLLTSSSLTTAWGTTRRNLLALLACTTGSISRECDAVGFLTKNARFLGNILPIEEVIQNVGRYKARIGRRVVPKKLLAAVALIAMSIKTTEMLGRGVQTLTT